MAVLSAEEIKKKFGYKDVSPLSEGLATVEASKAVWFHVYPNGEPAYDARFKFVGHFHEGMAEVYDGTHSFHIRATGVPAYAARFDHVSRFSEGLASVSVDGDSWHIFHDGTDAYDERYEACVSGFENGFAEMETQDGNLVKIRPDGSYLPYKYPHD